jgi:hypothetical protein
MCENATDCQPVNSTYYRYADNGLDNAIKQFFYEVEALLLMNISDVVMTNPAFKFIYEV